MRIREIKCLAFIFLFIGRILIANAGGNWKEIVDLSGKWRFNIGDNQNWSRTNIDDSDWEKVRVPDSWENQGFYGYDGFAWYRTSFDGDEFDDLQGSFSLFLGYIDDVDEAYFNGVKIGKTGSFPNDFQTAYNAKRVYQIPDELINYNGRNVIAVRVFDAGREGGIVSGDVGIYQNEEDRALAVNLRGLWNFKLLPQWEIGQEPDFDMLNRRTDSWVQIMAPMAWDHQGFQNYDGGAVYHKSISIPEKYKNENLILIIGAIDDNDWAYFNGKLIGQTNGYNKLRAYTITPDMYSSNDLNVLTIYIEDSAGYGGITEGPIGLIRQSDFTRFIRWR
ncbi:MAG: beta galactosidase jelly roll domain-containing protein [Reichenbachiella sp.]